MGIKRTHKSRLHAFRFGAAPTPGSLPRAAGEQTSGKPRARRRPRAPLEARARRVGAFEGLRAAHMPTRLRVGRKTGNPDPLRLTRSLPMRQRAGSTRLLRAPSRGSAADSAMGAAAVAAV